MSEDHYDTPWEFLARPASVRISSNHVRHSVVTPTQTDPHQLADSPQMAQSPSFSGQLVHIGNSPVEARRHSLRDHQSRGRGQSRRDQSDVIRREEEGLLEKNVDRVEAEKRLEGRTTGDFLLRSRGEGSAALSLRGSAGILHIKLERRGDKWVIGEGPCFRSIASAVHFYRKNPLPIRGSDHLLLKQAVTPPVHLQL